MNVVTPAGVRAIEDGTIAGMRLGQFESVFLPQVYVPQLVGYEPESESLAGGVESGPTIFRSGATPIPFLGQFDDSSFADPTLLEETPMPPPPDPSMLPPPPEDIVTTTSDILRGGEASPAVGPSPSDIQSTISDALRTGQDVTAAIATLYRQVATGVHPGAAVPHPAFALGGNTMLLGAAALGAVLIMRRRRRG